MLERIMPHALLLVLLVLQGAAADPSPAQRRRAREMAESLMAPCCYAENVQRHASETARAMRAEIAEMVTDGRTDREIRDHYIARYGRRVLHEPEGATWWILTAVPVVSMGAALLVGIGVLRRWHARGQPA
jgi:cytochrome c-type biogenesis protein CcmH